MKKIALALCVLTLIPVISSASTTSCPSITRTLSFGRRGPDVTQLQDFLIAQNVLATGNSSGYFGKLTQAGVQAFQVSNALVSSGSPSTTGYGAVGPRTRAAMNQSCNAMSSSNISSVRSSTSGFIATPIAGTAPLSVNFSLSDGAKADWVDFGDGTSGIMCGEGAKLIYGDPSLDPCGGRINQTSHTYTTPGTYTAQFFVIESGCNSENCNSTLGVKKVVGKVTIIVK